MLNQAREFHDTVGLTGLVLTKLDGTARGGAVVSVVDALRLPVKFIGGPPPTVSRSGLLPARIAFHPQGVRVLSVSVPGTGRAWRGLAELVLASPPDREKCGPPYTLLWTGCALYL